MANLVCHTPDHGASILTIEPLRPMRGMSDPHAYNVRLERDGAALYEARPSVAGCDEGHHFVYLLANAFRRGDQLLQRDLGFKLWAPGYADPGYGVREPAYLTLRVIGLEFVMTGLLTYKSREPRLQGELSLQTAPADSRGLSTWQRLTFYTPLAEAQIFGCRLYDECREASRLRRVCFPDDMARDPFSEK